MRQLKQFGLRSESNLREFDLAAGLEQQDFPCASSGSSTSLAA